MRENAEFTIGDVARRTGVAASTLRYYEELDLIAPVGRRGITRLYDESAFTKLEIVRLCATMGFTLEETRTLLLRASDRDGFAKLAQEKLAAVAAMRRDLDTATKLLRHTMECTCADVAQCIAASQQLPNLVASATRFASRAGARLAKSRS